jgi:hypothetical protein
MITGNMNNVLEALHRNRIDTLTKEALIRAFNDDGIFDLENVAEHMLKRIKHDKEIRENEPHPINFAQLSKLTPRDTASRIIHVPPEVPFILDGVAYDPQDIGRFNGQALHFTPIVAADGSTWLQAFYDEIRPILGGYFQVRQIDKLINPKSWDDNLPPPPGYPPNTGNPPPLGGCGYAGLPPCGAPQPPKGPPTGGGGWSPEPIPPYTRGQIQMFEDADYSGNWFWLAESHMWTDLTRVSRGGWFGGDNG